MINGGISLEFLVKKLVHLGYRAGNLVEVQLQELGLVGIGASLPPVEKHLPEDDSVPVNILKVVAIILAGQLVLFELLLCVLVILIQQFEEFFVQNYFRSDFVERLGSLEEFFEGLRAVFQPTLVLQVVLEVLLLEGLDLFAEGRR